MAPELDKKTLPKAAVVTIGDELLYGQLTDTNSRWLSTQLSKSGILPVRVFSVGDCEADILQILDIAQKNADVIVMTGGLGPTKDDVTKKALALFFGVNILKNDAAFAHLSDFLRKRGLNWGLRASQAHLPENAEPILNYQGTAAGMWFEGAQKIFIAMPGVPHEMKAMMSEQVFPKLQKRFSTAHIGHQIIRTAGITEPDLAELLKNWENTLPDNLKLAYLPKLAEVRLRLTAQTNTKAEAAQLFENALKKYPKQAKPFTYAYTNDSPAEALAKQLSAKSETLALAESCTGGLIARQITALAGCSAYFMGGVVAYSNASKQALLGVSPETIEKYGAVSRETALDMAKGIRKKMGATYGLAVSGIAGPTGGTPQKPVGTVWIAYASPQNARAKLLRLHGKRHEIMTRATTLALHFLNTAHFTNTAQ